MKQTKHCFYYFLSAGIQKRTRKKSFKIHNICWSAWGASGQETRTNCQRRKFSLQHIWIILTMWFWEHNLFYFNQSNKLKKKLIFPLQYAYTEEHEQQRGKGSFPAHLTPGYKISKKASEQASDVSENKINASNNVWTEHTFAPCWLCRVDLD